MQEDKLYDADIIKPMIDDRRFCGLFQYLELNSTQIVEFAWFLDSGKWNDYDNPPMKNMPIIVKNKSGMIFRAFYDGKNYFTTFSPVESSIRRTKAVWKYAK